MQSSQCLCKAKTIHPMWPKREWRGREQVGARGRASVACGLTSAAFRGPAFATTACSHLWCALAVLGMSVSIPRLRAQGSKSRGGKWSDQDHAEKYQHMCKCLVQCLTHIEGWIKYALLLLLLLLHRDGTNIQPKHYHRISGCPGWRHPLKQIPQHGHPPVTE